MADHVASEAVRGARRLRWVAAGDGFNAGYLAARLAGRDPAQAAGAAHRLAGDVIRHPGALVPRAAAAMH